jgi:HAD superfamily hydrolase (TIGR01509 family)
MVKAIIFDCFGVLATESWTEFRIKHFGHSRTLFNKATRLSNQADAGQISHDDEIRETAELASLTPNEVVRQISQNIPNEPLFEYIRELKPKYKIGMLSNASANWLDRMFTPEHLALFDSIKLSFESGVAKPDAGAYEGIAESLSVKPEECVLIDDNQRHCAGGQDCGMKTILYKSFEQTKTDLKKLLADPKS